MIHYRNDVRASGVNAAKLKDATRTLLRAVGEEEAELSLTLVDDAAIRVLNERYRGKNTPTDVLSFPQWDSKQSRNLEPAPSALGDIVISVETARRQAADYDAPLQREVERLLIHGLLHLLGHDHHEPGERKRMEAEERRLAQSIGMPWPYGQRTRR